MTSLRDILDRAADTRADPDLLGRLRGDPSTRAIVVREGRLRVADDAVLRAEVDSVGEAEWALLGRDRDG